MFIHDLTNKSVMGMHSDASQFALALAAGQIGARADDDAVEIAGAGHMLHFEAPVELAAAIETFLNKYL